MRDAIRPRWNRRQGGAILCVPSWAFCRAILCRAILAVSCALGVLVAPLPTAMAETEKLDPVEAYLERLGLNELKVLHLRQLLESGGLDEGRQSRVAGRLADAYAAELIRTGDDADAYQKTTAAVRSLLERYPQAGSPELDVMLLQGDYNRAENLITTWIHSPRQADAREEALAILRTAAPELNARRQQLQEKVESLATAIDRGPNGRREQQLEAELQQLQAVAGRATYFAGWANYYLGMLQGEPQLVADARQAFRQQLMIEQDAYEELDADWLGLDSIWRARTLLGLGLCEAYLDNIGASRQCFDLLKSNVVPFEVRDRADYWLVKGLLHGGHYSKALDFAEPAIQGLRGDATPGKVALCAALVRASIAEDEDPAVRRKLAEVGLEGLARLGEHQAILQLVAQYAVPSDDRSGFLVHWARGQNLLSGAEASQSADDYRQAARLLQQALDADDAGRFRELAARCRYGLAWCDFRLNQTESAAGRFRQAAEQLRASDPDVAADAAWMSFVAYRQLSDTDAQYEARAVQSLQTIQREFPEHEYAHRAARLLAQLQDVSAEEMIQLLAETPKSSTAYPFALFDIALLRHGQWSESDEQDKSAAAVRLLEALDAYWNAAPEDASPQRVRSHLVAAELLLTSSQPARAGEQLENAQRFLHALDDDSSLHVEYHFRRLQWADKVDRPERMSQYADWLMQHAAGTDYEVSALILYAQRADEAVAAASDGNRQQRQQHAHQVYGRLVERLGTEPEEIQTNKNARTALFRRVQYAYELGQFADAARDAQQLLAAEPNNQHYLRWAGLAAFQAGQYEPALDRWRTLLRGLPTETEDWWEAKYHQIACLLQTDRAAAERVWRQFRLLHPDIPSAAWRDKFRQLQRQFATPRGAG